MVQRIRRSFLFTPGDKPELLEKAAGTNADALIFDFEDAVPRSRKEEARENVQTVLSEVDFGEKEICVRINGLATPYWLADLEAAIEAGVHTIKLPMIESPQEVVTAVEAANQLTDDLPEFCVVMETPDGILSGKDIATTCRDVPQVTMLSFGLGDYCRTIGAPGVTPDSVRDFLSHLVTAYASIGDLQPLGAVHSDIDDLDGQRASAEQFYELGYVGQAAIHPDQIDIVNEAYTPGDDLVERARHLIDEYEAVETDSIVIDGVFLDTAVVERYRNILRRYEAVAGDG
ncbi:MULTISPECIES: CoA ester lyase [Halorussus]|uniref:HpcH/HpaI aldolase/citrate lyase family protein n=1 Tax=Halorussus TaxID=1070314 RepID=UPI000E20F39D|nr:MULTISPECIES: CoA ester lyase [Halorussus]NHN61677.1 CoA ester lyase [Halorussus sp. JP-T4]